MAAKSVPDEYGYSAPVRAFRWFVIRFFRIIEGLIRLIILICYGLKTMIALVFRYFYPYPIHFRNRIFLRRK
jgi:hypothetical protein